MIDAIEGRRRTEESSGESGRHGNRAVEDESLSEARKKQQWREKEESIVGKGKRNGGRVVYFKFFQTLGRTRRERKKASVAKGRRGVGRKGGGKEEEKGKKGKKGQSPGERYRGGNRGKRGRKKGRRESRARCSSFEPLDKFYIYSGWKLVESRSFLSSPLSSLIN